MGGLAVGIIAVLFFRTFTRSTKAAKEERPAPRVCMERMRDNATVPTKAYMAAGIDVYAAESHVLPSGTSTPVPIGWALLAPPGTYLRVAERSGLAIKGIGVGGGVIDADFTGEAQVILRNFGREPFDVAEGAKIAQIVPTVVENADLEEVLQLPQTERGERGFGSTGN